MSNHGEHNQICQQCQRECKQESAVKLLNCRRFLAKPKQLEIRFGVKEKAKK